MHAAPFEHTLLQNNALFSHLLELRLKEIETAHSNFTVKINCRIIKHICADGKNIAAILASLKTLIVLDIF